MAALMALSMVYLLAEWSVYADVDCSAAVKGPYWARGMDLEVDGLSIDL
jgi:hypothetical protein